MSYVVDPSRLHPRAVRIALVTSVVATLLSSTACSLLSPTAAAAKKPASLVVVQGASQSVQAGQVLPEPIVFRVVDSTGAGIHGVAVTLSVALGGGEVTPTSDTTDAQGEFTTKWTLGPGVVTQQILASVPGLSPIAVNATGLVPFQIILVQGNNQVAKAGVAVTNSIVVRIVDATNAPMSGITVGFQVLAGGGAMSPATVITDALGQASTKWTLGAVGANVGSVTSNSLAPVIINATGQ